MVTAAAEPRFLPRHELQSLIDLLAEGGRRVIGPTVADGAVVYDEIRGPADLPVGLRDEQAPGSYRLVETGSERVFDVTVGMTSWKRYTFPPVVPLTRASRDGAQLSLEPAPEPAEPMAFLGVRACELAALRIQDRVLTGGPFVDADYRARRDAALVVAAQCTRAGKTCFCSAMGTGPEVTDGADLVLTELDDGFLVTPGTARGSELLDRLPARAASAEQSATAVGAVAHARASMGHQVATDGLHDRLLDALDSPRWQEVADRCLACANCTLVCPTCFCTSVSQRAELDTANVVAERSWDSCFTAGFAKVAGGSFRNRRQDRYRQWLTHKFATWIDQFGSFGCVGCGRCIAWCPVGIDVREELEAIAPPAERLRTRPALASGTGPASYSIGTIRSVTPETADTFSLVIGGIDPVITTGTPGQFLMVEQPGFPAFPISISRYARDHVILTVRAAGPATAHLVQSEAGTQIGLRGPLGVGWPVERALGKDVVVATGGIGLAPLRPLLDALVASRDRFGKVCLYYGARTPNDMLYTDELASWPELGIDVALTVDRAGPEWLGRVGVVTQLFDQADWHGQPVVAYLCGPERMMQVAVRTVGERGIPTERTFVSLERHMQCGIGLCGHCQMGKLFICRDGPVFSVHQLGDALNVEGL
jgi:NAD(P)H-flavin reductase/formate hydrogenlyase subunit 6/NADH:ubiquinone oxidoreductase subunit I